MRKKTKFASRLIKFILTVQKDIEDKGRIYLPLDDVMRIFGLGYDLDYLDNHYFVYKFKNCLRHFAFDGRRYDCSYIRGDGRHVADGDFLVVFKKIDEIRLNFVPEIDVNFFGAIRRRIFPIVNRRRKMLREKVVHKLNNPDPESIIWSDNEFWKDMD